MVLEAMIILVLKRGFIALLWNVVALWRAEVP